jgi:Ser/Thr protein kinase RdoA (MazF antagonist)
MEVSHPEPAGGAGTDRTRDTHGAVCPLELLHPDGAARHRRILGRNCGQHLCPPQPDSADDVPSDLLIIAPDVDERRDPAFLQQVTTSLVTGMAPDGMAYVLAPAKWRRRLYRGLSTDFMVGPTLAHLPPRQADQYFVPPEGRVMRHTVAVLTSLRPRHRRLVDSALHVPGIGLLIARLLPEVGTVIRPARARALLHWLGVEGGLPSTAVIRTKWRGQGGTAVMHCFVGSDERPAAVVKAVLTPSLAGRVEREAAALRLLAPAAARAGVRVPHARIITSPADHPLLVQSCLDGRPAVTLFAEGLHALGLVERLAGWLESWNRATVTPGVLDEQWIDRELVIPAQRIAPLLSKGGDYLTWLREFAAGLLGSSLPRVASHNDLTMGNVLLAQDALPGVIDWEVAREDGIPLTDFFYLAVDAFAAARGTSDRAETMATCFSESSTVGGAVMRMAESMARAVQLPARLIPICFHACWIQHAANELEKRPQAPVKPFLAVVERLSLHPGGFIQAVAPWR